MFLYFLSFFFIIQTCHQQEIPCFEVSNAVCSSEGKMVIGINNNPKELIGYWNFDETIAIDQSGNKNHMDPTPEVGPESGGKGYSAYFDGNSQAKIKHSELFETSDLSMCFWIYLLKDSVGGWRTIIHKGEGTTQLTPSVLLWPKERRIHISVSTDMSPKEGLDSKSVIPLRRWTHVALIFSNQLIQLYINSILDNQIILQGQIMSNKGDIYIAKDPAHSGTQMYFDDFRIYKGLLKVRDIQSLAGPSMVIWGEGQAVLGCDSCNYQTATNSCPDLYLLCTIKELYSGAYHIARIMGWFRVNTEIWTRPIDQYDKNVNREEMANPEIFKMGVCCLK